MARFEYRRTASLRSVYSFQSFTDGVGLSLQHNHKLVKHGHERSFNKHLTRYPKQMNPIYSVIHILNLGDLWGTILTLNALDFTE